MDSYLFRVTDAEMQDSPATQIPPSHHIDPSQITTHNGWSVQLKDGSYMYIRSWKKDNSSQSLINGYRLVSPSAEDHCLSLPDKELLWIMNSDDRGHPITEVERPASDVLRGCRIIFTNQKYEALNYNTDAGSSLEPLYFCRWKRLLPSPTQMYRKGHGASRHLIGSVEHLRARDAHGGHRVLKNGTSISVRDSDIECRNNWRGPDQTVLRGSYREEVYEDLSIQQYTVGDAFCGAGGASQGALDANLRVIWAFDMNEDAMATYKKRFAARSGTECRLEECADFLTQVMRNPTPYIVDILHLSPPCQPFSSANTTPNEEKNAINHATFTAVEDLVRFTRPRVVTLEEAHALEWPSHREWFNKLLSMFMGLGYSVRWAVCELSNYGVPQTRKRLLMIASGPGEVLPSLPMPTHGGGRGLHPRPSINTAISGISLGALHHNPDTVHRIEKRPLNPFGLSGTIKCSGNSENVYHPSGVRYYTTIELACLQTFPIDYEFVGTQCSMNRQIGNAYPPLAAKAVFSEVRKSLQKADEEEMRGHGDTQ